jgi:hypothetical protein
MPIFTFASLSFHFFPPPTIFIHGIKHYAPWDFKIMSIVSLMICASHHSENHSWAEPIGWEKGSLLKEKEAMTQEHKDFLREKEEHNKAMSDMSAKLTSANEKSTILKKHLTTGLWADKWCSFLVRFPIEPRKRSINFHRGSSTWRPRDFGRVGGHLIEASFFILNYGQPRRIVMRRGQSSFSLSLQTMLVVIFMILNNVVIISWIFFMNVDFYLYCWWCDCYFL